MGPLVVPSVANRPTAQPRMEILVANQSGEYTGYGDYSIIGTYAHGAAPCDIWKLSMF